jgi:TetR/AcrR family transcriptional regulator, mexCD-oprJ operon repressor
VAAAILGAAAGVLADRGDQASMSDVATAAGVARATLYRYFPSRDALLDALGRFALDETSELLRGARLDQVAVDEGLLRAVRALVSVGDAFVVLAREGGRPDPREFEANVAAPVRGLLARGQSLGDIRDDVPATWLAEALFGLVVSVAGSGSGLGAEDTISTIASVFFDGARRRDGTPASAAVTTIHPEESDADH